MLTINIKPLGSHKYRITIFADAEKLLERDIQTHDHIEVFEKLEQILKCCSECHEVVRG